MDCGQQKFWRGWVLPTKKFCTTLVNMSSPTTTKPKRFEHETKDSNVTPTDSIKAVLADSHKTWQNEHVSLIDVAAHPTADNLYEAMRNNKQKYGLHVPVPEHYSAKQKERKAPPPTMEECKHFIKRKIAVKGKKQAIQHVTKMLKKGKMKTIDSFFSSK